MSVYTIVTHAEIETFLRGYDAGPFESYKGIDEGIENTNYFVNTKSSGSHAAGRYVLTIFEWQRRDDIPYFLELMAYLSERGLPCPRPVADRRGRYLQTLHDKPATLVSRLDGCSVRRPEARHCEQVGSALASLHTLAARFPHEHRNKRDWHWCDRCARKVLPFLDDEDGALLHEEICHHRRHHRPLMARALPRGVVHADLFGDNVLFDEGRLSGLIDFYYACDDDLIYDLAITVNAWCSDDTGALDEDNYVALVNAYAAVRSFLPVEKGAWQDALRQGALRFWLSRLHDAHFRKTGHITHIKDPDVYRDVLLSRKFAVPPLC